MGSPEAHQPPITAPTRPSNRAVTAPIAELRATMAALGSAVTLDEFTHTGVPASPLYQAPKKLAAPKAPNTRTIGTATRQANAPCKPASSARRNPAIAEVTQPPATKEKNAPATLKTNPQKLRSCRLTIFLPT